jgi:hypothetical protein
MTEAFILQWGGNASILLATYLLARKMKVCLVLYSLGNLLWIIWALQHHVWAIVVLDGILTVLNVRAWLAWKADEQEAV